MRDHDGVVRGARLWPFAYLRDGKGRQAELACGGETGGVRLVRKHDGDLATWEAPVADGLCDGQEV